MRNRGSQQHTRMKYHIYIEDSIVDDLVELDGSPCGPLSESVLHAGYPEEKTIEAANIDEAVKTAREWTATLTSDMPDYVTVIVEDLATGQHRRAGRVDVAEHEGHQAEEGN